MASLSVMIASCLSWQCIANVSADHYKVDRQLVKAIIAVESTNCKFTQNKYTKATGCMQVGKVHAPDRLALEMLRNPKYGIPEGVKLLKTFRRTCDFNLGKRGTKIYLEACKRYKNKLKKVGWHSEFVKIM